MGLIPVLSSFPKVTFLFYWGGFLSSGIRMSRAGAGVVVGWDEKQGAAFMGCRDHGHKCQLLILRGADLAFLERSGP